MSSSLRSSSGRAVASTCRRAYASSTVAPRGQSETLSYARPVASPSVDYAEAQRRGRNFYRDICRELPWIMDNYSLREVTTETRLRRAVKDLLRANMANIERYPEERRAAVLDVALMRAREELIAVEAHHFQRHHLITNFVNSSAVKANVDGKDQAKSAFLRDFLATQRTELN
jgi:NADH dehydrogenase (ubiquinone) 1 alpha subcomplex subunit 6